MPRGWVVAAVTAVCGLSIGVTEASSQEIRICEHKNLGGRCITLKHGVNDLAEWGLSNTISSFRITSGTWRLCTEDNLQGTCQDFSRSVSDLAGSRLQDLVSSLRPVREGSGAGGTAIVGYTAPDFRGRSFVFSHDESDLRNLGLNDRIESIRVLGGRWQVCTDINYVGCKSVSRDIPNLGAVGWGSRISSIREGDKSWNQGGGYPGGGYPGGGYPGGGSQGQTPTLTLFDDQNFRGRSYATQREVRNLADVNFNDMAVSIRIDGGRWEVCTDKNFRGQCMTLDRNNYQLASNFLRQISSVRPR